ncbi:Uncharacterized protein TCM_033202 [Theobroma cacao]|uniref:Reverse transcriptase domain-containing protein n=1 Tax=Theobroma cacao TaxID=3641 RepID=A0A061F9L1_THECC|nr:Uncharacterized protein TCM_033202 [Theobroma cacao]
MSVNWDVTEVVMGPREVPGHDIKAIKEWATPKNMTKLRSFLRLANYYRRFVEGYSKRIVALTELLKKRQKWNWM